MSGKVDPVAIQDLISRTALCLDDGDYAGFLALCSADFRYRVIVPSPELRKDMIWLDHDREGLEALFEALPEHLVRLGRLSRHLSPVLIQDDGMNDAVAVLSPVTVYDTRPDGRSAVFAVARYHDTIGTKDHQLRARTVFLLTRDIGTGSHVPL